MLYYLLIFLCSVMISGSLILLKRPFFSLARSTLRLLNIILDSTIEEAIKQRMLVQNVGKVLTSLGIFAGMILLTLSLSLLPIALYIYFGSKTPENLDITSFKFYGSMIVGFFIIFFIPSKNEKKDYSDWSVLLHQLILDNYNISKSLFRIEKKLFKRKTEKQNEQFVIVTGLARAGTTALTKLLFKSKKFHSLSFTNMPFLLAVNIWRKFYKPKKNKLKERTHGDKVMIGYKTIEALEEYFFKVFLKDKFITNKTLIEHSIEDDVYSDYLDYQNMINFNGDGSTYLAKNNNLILRYNSLRKHNPYFKIILIFRNPIEHAFSLMNQHKRFSTLQVEDPFILEYMNWIGHHEFGLNHKAFDLGQPGLSNQFDCTSINYWITLWISYYSRILDFLEDNNLILVEYSDFANHPDKLLLTLEEQLEMKLDIEEVEFFKKTEIPNIAIDLELEKKSTILHNKLIEKKLKLTK